MRTFTGTSYRNSLKLSSAAVVLGAAMLFSPSNAKAQQVVPGVAPNCAIIAGEAICEGDLEDGITAFPGTPDFDSIIIRDPDAPIAPPGYFGVGVSKDNGDLQVTIEDGVLIEVFDDPNIAGPAQGVIVFTQNGFDLSLDSAADIIADGNGSFALGIEAVALGGGSLFIENGNNTFNDVTINAFTSGDTAIALQGRTDSAALQINNTAALTAQSNGSGERNTVTAGILAVTTNQQSAMGIQNFGDISVTTGANSFDTDFNGIGAAIVANGLNSVGSISISNVGNLQASGPQTHGIVGFIESADANTAAELNIASGTGVDETSITVNGSGSYGILAQGRGGRVNVSVNTNSAIDLTSTGDLATGILALQQTQFGATDITNAGTITGRGDSVRGIGVSQFGSPVEGTYAITIANDGNITLDAARALGITASSTTDDDATLALVNNGEIDLSSSTDASSAGIFAFFNADDPGSTRDGLSTVSITNTGDITMGAGNAIFASADDLLIDNSGRLSTSADFATAVAIGAIGRDADGVAQAVFTTSGDVIAAGNGADAISAGNAAADGLTSITVSGGALVSGGTGDAVAIRLLGAQANSDAVDEVTDQATITKARLADRAQNLITGFISSSAPTPGLRTAAAVGGGEAGVDPLAVDPFDASGFGRLIEVDNATVESVMGAGAIVSDGSLAVEGLNGGIIRTGNDDAPVISAVEALAILASDTTFSSTGDNSALFSLAEMSMGNGTYFYGDLTDINATTSGANSDAIATGGGVGNSVGVLFISASDLAAPSVVSTSGDGSSAVSFDGPEGSTFTGAISRAEISTTGLNAAAIDLNMGSTSSASLELLDTLVSTAGNGSDVVRLNTGETSDYSFIIADSELTSEGDDSALVRVAGREGTNVGVFTMIGGTLSSMGDNSGGIITEGGPSVGGSSHTFFFGQSSITTAGQNSDGLNFGRDGDGGASIGSFTLDAVDITTGGANSDALAIETLDDGSVLTTTITNSNFATGGDNSRAYVSEALGNGSAKSLVIGDSTLITSGANSTALLVNDMALLDLDLNPDLQGDASIFSFDIGRSEISTMGDNSIGIDVATLLGDQSTTVISMEDNRVTTAGSNSDAISIGTQAGMGARASHTVSIDFRDIETGGDDSRGIYIGSLANGIGSPTAMSGSENATDATLFIGEGSITTAGARSHGIEFATIDGNFTDAIADIVAGNQTITTTGDDAIGLFVGGVTGSFVDSDTGTDLRPQLSVTLSPLSVTSGGAGSHGIQVGDLPVFDAADNADVTLTVLTRTITTTGDGAHGLVIGSGWGEQGSTNDDARTGSNRFSTVAVDGAINVSGAGSHGIVSDSLINDFSITDTGSITSADGFAIKFDGSDEDFTALNLGTIEGDVIFGGGDDTFDSSGTFTGNIDMGGGANAIFVRAGGLFNSLDSILLGAGNAITVEGDISPGGDGPIQTTAIGSDLFFEPGSRFLIDIDGMAADPNAPGFFQSDRITVDGNIVIEDATLAVSSLTPEGDFDRSAQFLILDAAGTLTGEFSAIDADLPFLDLTLTYDMGQVILNAGRQGPVVPFASLGLTPNQRAVGASFDALEMDATGDLDDVVEQLIFANTDQALTAFDSTSGEIYASLLAQASNDGLRRSREALVRARNVSGSGIGLWGGVNFSETTIDGDGNGAEVELDDVGFDFGVDYVGEDNGWAAGIATGWRDGDLAVAQRRSSADFDAWYVSGHARAGTGGVGPTISAVVSYSQTDASVVRALTVNALSRTAFGQAEIDTFSLGGEARYGFAIGGNWAIGPVVSIMHSDSDLMLDNETGAGSVALSSADASDGQTRFGGGLFANLRSETAVFDLAAQYVDGSANTVGARLAFAGGSTAPFTVLAPIADQSGALTSASASFDLGSGWTIGAQVEAMIGSDINDLNASAVVGWRF